MNSTNTYIQANTSGSSDAKPDDSIKASQDLKEALSAWLGEYLVGLEPLELLLNENLNPNNTTGQAIHSVTLDAFLGSRLDLYASETGVELSSIFLSIWQALIFRYSQKRDLAIVVSASPINSQLTSEPEVLVLRQHITGTDNLDNWIKNSNEALSAIEHLSQLPISWMSELPDHLNILIGNNSNLYQYNQIDNRIHSDYGIQTDALSVENNAPAPSFELSLFTPINLDNDRTLNLQYDRKFFSQSDIEDLLANYVTLLGSALESPSKAISKQCLSVRKGKATCSLARNT